MKKKNFLAKNYEKSFKFLRESKRYIYIATGIFVFFAVFGFLFPVFFEEEILEIIKELSRQFEGKGAGESIWLIFANNTRASFLAILFGITFGIFPFITAMTNGYLVGFVSRMAVDNAGIGILWRLVPHGIFELPAIMMSIGLGLKIGIEIFQKNATKKFKYNILESARFFVLIVIPLLILAAIIEGILITIV